MQINILDASVGEDDYKTSFYKVEMVDYLKEISTVF